MTAPFEVDFSTLPLALRYKLLTDAELLRVNLDAYKPIARLFGNLYARLGEKLVLKRQRVGGRERCRRGGRSRRDEVLIHEWIAQVVEPLSTRRKGRRLKFAAHEMKKKVTSDGFAGGLWWCKS